MLTPALNILHLAHTERKARKQTSKMEEDREETRLHHCCDINSEHLYLDEGRIMDWKSPDYLRYCWRDRSLCLLLCYSPVDVGGRCNNDIIIIINRNILNLNPQLLKRANEKNIVKIGEISRKVGLYHWITFEGN